MVTELVRETSADHVFSLRSALENLIEFCPSESFQTFKIIIVRNLISRCYVLLLFCYILYIQFKDINISLSSAT
jgi:hypothetical protein